MIVVKMTGLEKMWLWWWCCGSDDGYDGGSDGG